MPGLPFTVSGIISDVNGAATQGVTVTLTDNTTHHFLSATTDAFGQFQIEASAMDSGVSLSDWLLIHASYASGNQSGELTKQVTQADLTSGGWLNANITMKYGSLISDGLGASDFLQIISDMGRIVSYKSVTKSIDQAGSETSTFATATNQRLIFFREENRYIWDKAGLLQVGDAYLIAPITLGIKRYDQFTVDGNTFYIENVTRRHVMGAAMADYATCFLVA